MEMEIDRHDPSFRVVKSAGDLQLNDSQFALLTKLIKKVGLDLAACRFKRLDAGMAPAKKVIVKQLALYPLFVKIDQIGAIQRELDGDKAIRLRVPSASISDICGTIDDGTDGAIAYRYFSAARVTEEPQRLDIWSQGQTKEPLIRVIDYLYEDTLKKLHWQAGRTVVREIDPPRLESSLPRAQPWIERYDSLVSNALKGGPLRCPVGGVHGDLHSKNIVVIGGRVPHLIDFSEVSLEAPIVLDFAKLDAFFPLAVLRYQPRSSAAEDDFDNGPWVRVVTRLYQSGSLILPRSARIVPSVVHEIRSSFWRGCMSKTHNMQPDEIDRVYGVFLAYFLCRFLIRREETPDLDRDSNGVLFATRSFKALTGND
jgi:hypothetical protein